MHVASYLATCACMCSNCIMTIVICKILIKSYYVAILRVYYRTIRVYLTISLSVDNCSAKLRAIVKPSIKIYSHNLFMHAVDCIA